MKILALHARPWLALPQLRGWARWPVAVWLAAMVPLACLVMAVLLAQAADRMPATAAADTAARVALSCALPPAATTGASADSGCRRSATAGAPAP